MSFIFEIEGLTEIHRDPAAHYRHWTLLQGYLAEGEIVRETPILLVADNGDEYASRVLGFDTKGNIGTGECVIAGGGPVRLGLITWMPALPSNTPVVRARECSEEERENALISMLGRDPGLFFHHIDEGTDRACTDCVRALRVVADRVRPLMLGLAERTSGSLAELIRLELARTHPG